MSLEREEFGIDTCPVKLTRLYNQLKDGSFQSASDAEIICSEGCEGLRSAPRVIGSIVLPSIFDRTYCGGEVSTQRP